MVEEAPVHGVDPLVLHQPRVEGHRGLVRDDGLRLLPREPAPQAANREGRAEHEALEVLLGQRHSQLPLDAGPVERDAPHQLPLGGGRRDHAILQALHERGPVRGGHGGQEPHQPPGGIRHVEVAGVHVAARRFQRQLEREDAARPEGDRGPAAGVLGAVRDHHEVGVEELLVALGEGPEVLAAHLLLAVEDELEPDPGCDAQAPHQLERGEVRPDRTLVVGGPASVEPVAGQGLIGHLARGQGGGPVLGRTGPEHGLERGGLEPSGGRGRLHIIVAVDQERPLRSRAGERAVDSRVSTRFHDAGLEPACAHRPGEPLGPGPDSIGLLADRVEAQEVGEAVHDGPTAGRDGSR